MSAIVGKPVTRVDGPAKVSGKAQYAADFALPRMAHALLVESTIAKGRVTFIRSARATALPGVLLIMTHENAPRLPSNAQEANPPGERALSLLQDAKVRYNGEPVAVIVAETPQIARHAALLLDIEYAAETATLDFAASQKDSYAPAPTERNKPDVAFGDAQAALSRAAKKVDAVYRMPIETHNPMEPHATLAAWSGEELVVHDSTQGVSGTRKALAKKLGVAPEKVRVISPFVGGGFGCKGSAWSHVVLVAMAAKQVGRPVRLALERTQMFGPVGYRPLTEQHVALGAEKNGKLVGISHEVTSSTSTFEDWSETSAVVTRMLYACPNVSTKHRLVKLDLGTPTFMRAPGEASGTFAIESAMDELAHELGLDPLELRLRNHADSDPESGKPFSCKSLRACYAQAAERFGWARRNPTPGSMREGASRIGWGMATATYPANRQPAKATVTITADGNAIVRCGTQDIGTGTYTILAQVAADELGLSIERVSVELGDSSLPEAPVSGGSMSAASTTPAVQAAARDARNKLVAAAIAGDSSQFAGLASQDFELGDGWIASKADKTRREPFGAVVARAGGKAIEGVGEAALSDADKKAFSMHSFGAVFVEVSVDAFGQVRVRRVVARYGVGRLLNAKTAHNQLAGGIVWGIGMALHEQTSVDRPTGRVLNNNLAQYHVPVNADVPDSDIAFVDEDDQHFNPLGAKGIGEIGITGVAAAIANAVFHATGKRIRELPITPDRL